MAACYLTSIESQDRIRGGAFYAFYPRRPADTFDFLAVIGCRTGWRRRSHTRALMFSLACVSPNKGKALIEKTVLVIGRTIGSFAPPIHHPATKQCEIFRQISSANLGDRTSMR